MSASQLAWSWGTHHSLKLLSGMGQGYSHARHCCFNEECPRLRELTGLRHVLRFVGQVAVMCKLVLSQPQLPAKLFLPSQCTRYSTPQRKAAPSVTGVPSPLSNPLTPFWSTAPRARAPCSCISTVTDPSFSSARQVRQLCGAERLLRPQKHGAQSAFQPREWRDTRSHQVKRISLNMSMTAERISMTTSEQRHWHERMHQRTKQQRGLLLITIVFVKAIESGRPRARTSACGLA